MRLTFSTLFNINYLAKGLALHASLLQVCPDFHLYIFAFDEASYLELTARNLANATIISLREFESPELLKVKTERSVGEYCWTCTSFTIKYCLEHFKLDHCTYLDADMYFYKDPSRLVQDMGENSVLITPHNYGQGYDQSAIAGIYCVQFLTIKNTPDGNRVLDWWTRACLKWCYARYEDGKMGDQKYLDCWPYVFEGVYICRDINAGAAPWNAGNYPSQNDIDNIIFYHFHDLQYFSDGTWFTGGYDIPLRVLDSVYRPYTRLLKAISETVEGKDCLYTKDKKSFRLLNSKYKIGSYVLDLKNAFSAFFEALFYIKKRKFYKRNFIK
ncbi:glycosyl transferase [Mucilaginibacter sp. BT774]|uniref:glycosyl transferase n=1 Tax=Mucilaginibacter sp. BT774 TaxID=3062276 RepID=UPI0026760001|nr:glycosyl transferase [Mucilaginibacter sp. BT774]MDO3627495.1 glycosyl transferase [Mucilaginibacter sp. BT774]